MGGMPRHLSHLFFDKSMRMTLPRRCDRMESDGEPEHGIRIRIGGRKMQIYFETEHLLVRELEPEDAEQLYANCVYTFLICSSANDVEAQATAKVKAWTKKVNNVMKPNVKLNLLKR